MPGPPPKDARARRRYNPPAGGEWVDLAPLERPVLRELPARPGEGGWSRWARELWESWRQDPVTVQWTAADVGFALDTIRLVDASARSPRATFASELRLRMDPLGLTPKGRRNLRWRVVEAGELVDHPTRPAGRTSVRKRRLRAVDDQRSRLERNNGGGAA